MITLQTIEYRGWTITESQDVRGEDYGHSVEVADGGEVWEFNTMDEAKAYLDDLVDEMERRAKREYEGRWWRHTIMSRRYDAWGM